MSFGNLRQVTARYVNGDAGRIYRKRVLAAIEIFKNPSNYGTWTKNCWPAVSRAESDADMWLDEYSAARVIAQMQQLDEMLRIFSGRNAPMHRVADVATALDVILRQYDEYMDASELGRAVIDARRSAATRLAACCMPGDVFSIITTYVEPPYRLEVPTCGPARHSSVEEVFGLTTSLDGSALVSAPWHCELTALERQLYEKISVRTLAFSKTHTAVCTLLGQKPAMFPGSTIRLHALPHRWTISIRRNDQRHGTDEFCLAIDVCLEPAYYDLACNAEGTFYSLYRSQTRETVLKRVSLHDRCQSAEDYFYFRADTAESISLESACGEYLTCNLSGIISVYRIPADVRSKNYERCPLEIFAHGEPMNSGPLWPGACWRTTTAAEVDSSGRLLCTCLIQSNGVSGDVSLGMWSYDTMAKTTLFALIGWLPGCIELPRNAHDVTRMRLRPYMRNHDKNVYFSYVDTKKYEVHVEKLVNIQPI